MTTYTLYGRTGDGYLESYDTGANYTAARDGTGDGGISTTTSGTDIYVGQSGGGNTYDVIEAFVSWDTTTVANNVTSATISLYCTTAESSGFDWTLYGAVYDWESGGGLGTGDWNDGAALNSLTVTSYYTITDSSHPAANAYFNLTTGDVAFVNHGGITSLILFDSRQDPPSSNDMILFRSSDYTGTTQDPKLVVIATSLLAAASLTGGHPPVSHPTLVVPVMLTASSLTGGQPTFGAPVLLRADVTFGDYVLDNGLGALATYCDKIYVCSATPASFADATVANALGNKDFGAGNAFAAPSVGTGGGRKTVATAITDGVITGNGTVVCWAAVDTVNARLLASGPIVNTSVTLGQGFSLDAFAVHWDN